ncbi:tissue-type plasminogen activator-like isoform X1 [Oncorhynchus keta]|uniref:tissue-type plasminogen activator-like isoform X1 n=1 Tax=Oncorhynchus keta TaxID=8018 RepID=UPI0015FD554D|nr:tissue-type plasminogen activator-like isoform X1 [Oncorhynchus keta]XP_035641830.1 tissue-type plasminogen activator-like isoform X1 [Oncorhynchus keta]
MARILGLLFFLSALCCSLADKIELRRAKRGTRYYRARCVDGQSAAVRGYGDTWMRWRGQRVEYCRCASQGRERCHYVPVITCYQSRCYNGGTCKEAVYSTDFLCQCPPGFTGAQCEINTNEKCVVGQGKGYRGTWSISRIGSECINWNSTTLRGKKFTAKKPEANSLGLGNHNFCRNPDNDTKPWCYVYKGNQIVWEFCTLSSCPADQRPVECVQASGQTYRGTKAVTKRGSSCLPWDSPLITRKFYNAWRSDARQLGLGSHNFCRNPDGDLSPWCHVYKNMKLTWELCDITKCTRRPTTITTLGPRAPTSNNNNRGTCGQRADNNLPSFRILGGARKSDITEQPWQAAISVYQPRNKAHIFQCGGVLIDSCWVLSAAHCFDNGLKPERLQVVLGRTFRKNSSGSEQIFEVEKYWSHEKYNETNFDNDIVLMKLKSDIGLCAVNSPEVLPACLPDPGLVLPDWTECEISGYGREKEFDAMYSERVKRGHVRLWPQDRCVPTVLSERVVTSNMLCAGDTRGLDDACKGDSGGPLVCPKDGRMTLMGLISWGDGCGKKDKPGVYTRVTQYTDWISSKKQETSQ